VKDKLSTLREDRLHMVVSLSERITDGAAVLRRISLFFLLTTLIIFLNRVSHRMTLDRKNSRRLDMFNKRHLQDIIKGPAHVLYHVVLIALSASVALSLPYTADFIAEKFLLFWALIGNEKVFLVSVEIVLR